MIEALWWFKIAEYFWAFADMVLPCKRWKSTTYQLTRGRCHFSDCCVLPYSKLILHRDPDTTEAEAISRHEQKLRDKIKTFWRICLGGGNASSGYILFQFNSKILPYSCIWVWEYFVWCSSLPEISCKNWEFVVEENPGTLGHVV